MFHGLFQVVTVMILFSEPSTSENVSIFFNSSISLTPPSRRFRDELYSSGTRFRGKRKNVGLKLFKPVFPQEENSEHKNSTGKMTNSSTFATQKDDANVTVPEDYYFYPLEEELFYHSEFDVSPSFQASTGKPLLQQCVFTIPDEMYNSTKNQATKRNKRKVNKLLTAIDSPYAVMLLIMNYQDTFAGVCSGTLISSYWVLTSASCINRFPNSSRYSHVIMVAGSASKDDFITGRVDEPSQALDSVKYYVHPRYHTDHVTFDAALLQTDGFGFKLTKSTKWLKLSTNYWNPRDREKITKITGFGEYYIQDSLSNYRRQTFEVDVKTCGCSGDNSKEDYWMLCSVEVDKELFCRGHWGGGLFHDGELIGVVTGFAEKGVRCTNTTTPSDSAEAKDLCASPTSVIVIQDVCPLLEWISMLVVGAVRYRDIPQECRGFNKYGQGRGGEGYPGEDGEGGWKSLGRKGVAHREKPVSGTCLCIFVLYTLRLTRLYLHFLHKVYS